MKHVGCLVWYPMAHVTHLLAERTPAEVDRFHAEYVTHDEETRAAKQAGGEKRPTFVRTGSSLTWQAKDIAAAVVAEVS